MEHLLSPEIIITMAGRRGVRPEAIIMEEEDRVEIPAGEGRIVGDKMAGMERRGIDSEGKLEENREWLNSIPAFF
jgi:hypothetical protein